MSIRQFARRADRAFQARLICSTFWPSTGTKRTASAIEMATVLGFSPSQAIDGVTRSTTATMSVSRVVTEIADEPWRLRIRKLKRLVSAYSANRDLIAIGAYQRGNDAATDEALERWPEIMEFLGQDVAKAADLPHSQAALQRLVEQES